MAKKKKELTPLMQQYWQVKSAHADKILLFRMGDFFEMFYEDAQKAAPILGIALTARNKKSGDSTPMCGVPHHSIAAQINKLLNHGLKVAICDQVEDPKLAKGLVKREVTRILSPGMVYDPETLDSETPNYLCAFDKHTLAFMEPTTGECFYYLLSSEEFKKQIMVTLAPVEIVVTEKQKEFVAGLDGIISEHGENFNQYEKLPESCRRLLSYATSMQGDGLLKSLRPFEQRDCEQRLQLSHNVFRHLEVFKTYKGETSGTVFAAVNRTKTAGGARLLKQWLHFPLADQAKIENRQRDVEKWTKDIENLKAVRADLSQIGDMERKLGKITNPNCHPRDLQGLGQSLEVSLKLIPYIQDGEAIDELTEMAQSLSERMEKTFVEDIPAKYSDGGFIDRNVSPNLDELIDLASSSQKKVQELEAREKDKTGIPSLKVRYNNVFGYYIEVTNTHKSKVPKDRYQRKQTLTNAERYVTEELNELEKKVLSAKTKRTELELEIFNQRKEVVIQSMALLLKLAYGLNQLDVLSSLAWLAIENSYTKPQFVEKGAIQLEGSRHPVVEQFVEKNFVANDIEMSPHQCLLLTGPNMAGKSTFMRQIAITCILGQIGSFVPARAAQLPVVDKIFTRIGASDFLTEGLSTFMVEMKETAEMLKEATPQSLVILDEVGRGTSTYDGMSLAQSILEYFVKKLKSTTLFATHYHELTALEQRYPDRLMNKHMSIIEKKGDIEFLYTLSEGPALKSYGIQVARLAGIPKEVIQYASQLLNQHENGKDPSSNQLDLFQVQSIQEEDHPLMKALLKFELQKKTPLDALNQIAQWQDEFQ